MKEKALIYLNDIRQDYPNLRLKDTQNDKAIYEGVIAFKANHPDKGVIDDQFEVQINLPLDNSEIMPTAKEIGGRIPRKIDYHVQTQGDMCLGAPLEVCRRFSQDPSLKGFIENLLVPFLYSFSFKEKYGEYPFGELPHGHEGIYEFYKVEFKTNNGLAILGLLKILVEDNYRGHMTCACGSHMRLRECHGDQIREIKNHMNREHLLLDFYHCISVYRNEGNKLPRNFITKRLQRYLKKVLPSTKT